jgi:hypothetical protein
VYCTPDQRRSSEDHDDCGRKFHLAYLGKYIQFSANGTNGCSLSLHDVAHHPFLNGSQLFAKLMTLAKNSSKKAF